MVDLYLRSPFGHRVADLERLEAVEVAHLAQVAARCDPVTAQRLGFPVEPNTVAGTMERGVLWLGPDEWLVVGLPGASPALVEELEAALAGSTTPWSMSAPTGRSIELRGDSRHAAPRERLLARPRARGWLGRRALRADAVRSRPGAPAGDGGRRHARLRPPLVRELRRRPDARGGRAPLALPQPPQQGERQTLERRARCAADLLRTERLEERLAHERLLASLDHQSRSGERLDVRRYASGRGSA